MLDLSYHMLVLPPLSVREECRRHRATAMALGNVLSTMRYEMMLRSVDEFLNTSSLVTIK